MGIKGLGKLIERYAPKAKKEGQIEQYSSRVVAIDASILLYQFISSVRDQTGATLVDEYGETTSHIIGTFYRTIKFIENGIKPVYVFDGKPPELKSDELAKRNENAAKAKEELEKAIEDGNDEMVKTLAKRTARMTIEQSNEVKRLLELMGIPCIDAECEAEATCAELVKLKKCYATATEDMDSLTLGSSVVLRKFSPSADKKKPIMEFNLEDFLSEAELTMDQFIDLCILLGCDYCETIKGIGPVHAYEMIQEYENIETILENLGPKYTVPDNWKYKEAREMFKNPIVSKDLKDIKFEWKKANEEEIIKYLVGEKHFNEEKVKKGLEKLRNAKAKKTQGRLDSFFTLKKPVKKEEKEKGVKRTTAKKATTKKKK